MPSTDSNFYSETAAPSAPGKQAPGPLAWVVDGLYESLKSMAAALARCARGSAPHAQPGSGPLDIPAMQQALHQAGRSLQMLEMGAPMLLVQALEAALLRLAQEPDGCTPEAAGTLENACLALLKYLEAGRQGAAVALFAPYRAVQSLAGNDKVHPADLWLAEQRVPEPAWEEGVPHGLPYGAPALPYGPQARAVLDASVLAFVKTGEAAAAAQLRAACLGFAVAQAEPEARTFWRIAAGFFDALAQGLVESDIYAKRTTSRVLLQYATMAKGDSRRPERLTSELLFFCAQAGCQAAGDAGAQPSVLRAVRSAYGLECRPPLSLAPEGTGDELRALFLEEAHKAVRQGVEALAALAADAADRSALAQLRRAFHALKGSARMAGLDEFGEAGAAMEQMLHGLDGQQPVPAAFQALAREALQALAAWADAMADGRDQDWSATPFRAAADAMRLVGQRAPVALRPSRRRRMALDTPAPPAQLPQTQETSPLPLPDVDADAAEGIDFAAIECALQASQSLAQSAPALAPALACGAGLQVPEAAAQPAAAALDGAAGRIDGLGINAYLNAADEWSRRLETMLQEWRLAPQRPQPEDAAACAHALAGSSAAVGFKDLSRLAGLLEQALMHARAQGAADAQQLEVFQAAASEIRRLLHQFAAGFLKPPQPPVEEALQRLLDQLASQPLEASVARSRMDACLEQARSSLHDLGATLERLRQPLRALELQAEMQLRRQALSRASAQGSDALEVDRNTRMHERMRRMAGSVADVAAVQRRLQRQLAAAEDEHLEPVRQGRGHAEVAVPGALRD
ncbi:Hpt domain-containing protein [Comamonas endophytica]|uniref:Hpt domain-containing protein n=1 Tax=Comamonas endophytica TaxID=2949090 RepID=A0ABY6G6L8_9BURK|nr:MULTISPECIES: Hpt domain-containing protein [unclassified Acidovorax]MCD2511271.1 Hpt domain-containing protein [Acidovorax sp. D4N7]UYG50666.1 Hpt domain-containing protein [Acidovorax sp. 5MLIR]